MHCRHRNAVDLCRLLTWLCQTQDSQGTAPQQKGGGGEEPLPAGLALLRKLQAQGGVTRRSMSGSPATGQQHTVFQDPAILSATPSPEYGESFCCVSGRSGGDKI